MRTFNSPYHSYISREELLTFVFDNPILTRIADIKNIKWLYLAVVHNMQRAVQWRESDVGRPVKLHRVGLKVSRLVIMSDQSEASTQVT